MSGHVPCCHLIDLQSDADVSRSTELIQVEIYYSWHCYPISGCHYDATENQTLPGRKRSHRKSLSILSCGPIICICSFSRLGFQVVHKIVVFIITLSYLFLVFWSHLPPYCPPLSLSPLLLLAFLPFNSPNLFCFQPACKSMYVYTYLCMQIHMYSKY